MLEPLMGKLNQMRIILASSSKRREELLKSTGLKFEILPSDFDENLDPMKHTFSEFVEKTALGKTEDVYNRLKNDSKKPDLIIGVDTMVTFNGKMYGKPKNFDEAIAMIKDLTQNNLPNSVYTGVAIWYDNNIHTFTEVSTVYMTNLTDEEVESYVKSGEPMGKAGGYGIQGIAGTFIERIDGDGNNVIGLPLCRLTKELKRIIEF